MIKISLFGAAGRMGGAILNVLPSFKNITLAHAVESADFPHTGKKIGKGMDLEHDHSHALDDIDVAIDFTWAESSITNLKFAAASHKPMVIGATGHNAEQKAHILSASKIIPIVLSPNMSVGVNTMWKLIEEAASILDKDYKIDIVESHHVHKKDAPSGTAKKMIEEVGGKNKEGRWMMDDGREIEVRSIREGDVAGDHTITFTSPYEKLEITHRAFSREVFAAGALKAAEWVVGKRPGLYGMSEVLDIVSS
ncbi:MAG: 4-hydroxy-tetrahydrodipicolinate reductase [Deltaproteobacteria bacterium CG11_big_fil_rev_8_21_14_0_20_49_13]|nr:MAG: 4-hydroxy-tetrahydrodipicolinate reductase [Deltaproteobacteria bacterium CG11_big_fil_rev_8_21_14_0_20_49_13]